ncbi:hypothetical protein GGI35DRAFT_442233 [Trichoderma velutinum]
MHASNMPRTTGKGDSFISAPYNSLFFFPSVNFRTVATMSVCMHVKEKERKKVAWQLLHCRLYRGRSPCLLAILPYPWRFPDDEHHLVVSVAVSCHRKLPLPCPTTSLPTPRISLSADGRCSRIPRRFPKRERPRDYASALQGKKRAIQSL